MTPPEYIELIREAFNSTGAHAMNAISIIFAYIAASYLAGSKLTRFQFISVTVLYSIYLLFPAQTAVNSFRSSRALLTEFISSYPDIAQTYFPPAIIPVSSGMFAGTLVLGWGISIIFMLSVRKNTENIGKSSDNET